MIAFLPLTVGICPLGFYLLYLPFDFLYLGVGRSIVGKAESGFFLPPYILRKVRQKVRAPLVREIVLVGKYPRQIVNISVVRSEILLLLVEIERIVQVADFAE